jgi:UDP-N-acetylglucosamine 2-epimerase (non-hydrolysing)
MKIVLDDGNKRENGASRRFGRNPRAHYRVMTLFGTRPEIIKLAPVIAALEIDQTTFHTINVSSGQHADLLPGFLKLFNTRIDYDLRVMRPAQSPSDVVARVIEELQPLLHRERPDMLLVQGDTTTALAGALAGFYDQIAVGHIEAGLRSGDATNPFPEEMNRRLITQLASCHFAATSGNRENLLREGVNSATIFVTGNPVIDSLKSILAGLTPGDLVRRILDAASGRRLITMTAHRRESFGEPLRRQFMSVRNFVERYGDVILAFPVHPNPRVQSIARDLLTGHERIWLMEPLCYLDFIGMLSESWLILSDSGGVQEEAATLGKPLIVLRKNTERPEVVESGVARLTGERPEALDELLEEVYHDPSWAKTAARSENPFGNGQSGGRICHGLASFLTKPGDRRRNLI